MKCTCTYLPHITYCQSLACYASAGICNEDLNRKDLCVETLKCMQLCPASTLCEQSAHVVRLLTGAELLVAENQSWCKLDHHGC